LCNRTTVHPPIHLEPIGLRVKDNHSVSDRQRPYRVRPQCRVYPDLVVHSKPTFHQEPSCQVERYVLYIKARFLRGTQDAQSAKGSIPNATRRPRSTPSTVPPTMRRSRPWVTASEEQALITTWTKGTLHARNRAGGLLSRAWNEWQKRVLRR